MICLDDLYQAAAELRKRGVAAEYVFLYGPHGGVEGLGVGEDFFPSWELRLAENADEVARDDFEAIKQRRPPGWTIEPPVSLAVAVGNS